MVESKKKILKKKYIIFLIIYFSFLAIYISSLTVSKYIGTVEKEGNQVGIAKPIINVNVSDPVDKVTPDDTLEIDFDVTNYDGDNVNEVKLKYTITLSVNNQNNIPLSFKLYDESDNEIALNNNRTTNQINMVAGTKTSHSYKLIVYWDGDDSYNYQDLSENLNITTNVIQSQL